MFIFETLFLSLISVVGAIELHQLNSLPARLDRPYVSPFGNKCSVTSSFGPRTHPVTGEANKLHNGVDLMPPAGFKDDADLRPPAAGIIEEINNTDKSDTCGLWVKIRVTKTQTIQMCHMADESTIKGLKKGDPVMTTTKLGVMGATGRVTGKHLHMIVAENGKPIDPSSQITQACKTDSSEAFGSRSQSNGVSR